MKPGRRRVYCHIILKVFLVLQLSWLGTAFAADFSPDAIRWSKLRYSATKLLITVNTDVEFHRLTGEEAMGELITVPEGEAKSPGDEQVMKLSLTTDVLGLRSMIDVWMKPDTSILQRTSLSTGRNNRYRILRYMPEGAYSVRRRPSDKQEEELVPDLWTNVREGNYATPENERSLPVGEAEGIFYLVAAADISKPGDTLTAYMYDEEGAIEVTLTAVEVASLKVAFDEKKAGSTVKISKPMDTLKIHVSASSYSDKAGETDFQFLGCKGDIDIYLDLQRRVIVQVSGKVDYLGIVNIRLKEIETSNLPTNNLLPVPATLTAPESPP